MEKLKCLVPESLKRKAANSNCEDLPSLSSSLVDLFLSLQQFHELIGEVAVADSNTGLCGKNLEAALDLKRKGNQCYSKADYSQALRCYSQALRLAPFHVEDMGKNLAATLYLNRASLFQKICLLKESLRDCRRALQIFPSYSKAWYRRGKVNASLGNYEDAVRDLTIAKDLEPSLDGKKQIKSELDILEQHHERKSIKPVYNNQKGVEISDVPQRMKPLPVTTLDKGRGMASQCDIPQASLIHIEKPYAVVIMKHCRKTHCHYCLNELPADFIPCMSCSMPLYCSDDCQLQAGGQRHDNYSSNANILKNKSNCIQKYIADITIGSHVDRKLECFPEHKHECKGVHWPAVLPSDVVLAARVIVKSMEQKGQLLEVPNFLEALIVILLSQIRVNSMAVVRMKSGNVYDQRDSFEKIFSHDAESALTTTVEQVRVGQALYMTGSLFNHSCHPNIHAYFISRSLLVRTTEFVTAGCPLELSYGPQVGQWDYKDRLRFLEDNYLFRCRCCACVEVNAPDLIINGYSCVNPNCFGVVLDDLVAKCEEQRPKNLDIIKNASHLQVNKVDDSDMNKVTRISLEKVCSSLYIRCGYCLKCGSCCNLPYVTEAAKKAWIPLRRLQESIALKVVGSLELSDALRSLGFLRSILHSYNKAIAEAEDNLAQAFCFTRDLESARDHCKSSIEILEKLYGSNHIVIGYELVKLSSILLSLSDCAAVDTINRLSLIYAQYYGPHADIIFPYLMVLRQKVALLAAENANSSVLSRITDS